MKRFLSFLGTGRYQPCRYCFDGKASPEVTFVQTAVNLAADPRCGEADVFCTEGARTAHADGLVAEFLAHGLPPPRIVPIPDGASESQLWEIFRIVRDIVGDGDEIVFDVTHSFRSLPVIMTVLLRYLAVAKRVTLGDCLYGAWDARVEEEGKVPETPVFNLTPFFALDDWTRAIRDFEAYGDPAALKNLAVRRLGPLCRTQESARRISATVKTMSLFAENVRLANLGIANRDDGIRNMPLRSGVALPLSQGETLSDLPELQPVLEQAAEEFTEYGDRDLRNGFRAARWAARHGLLPQAYTLLQETAISTVLENHREIIPGIGDDVWARDFVGGVLSRASLPGFDWDQWTPQETKDAALSLKDRLPPEFIDRYARLVRIRNAINHAGTSPQAPVKPNGADYSAGNFMAIASDIETILLNTL